MKVIDFENFLLHPDLAVAEAAISGRPDSRFRLPGGDRGDPVAGRL